MFLLSKKLIITTQMFMFPGARPKPIQTQPVDLLGKTSTDQLVQGAASLSLSQQNRNPSEQNIDFSWNRLVLFLLSLV